jgi:soluble lytic murein transglycosylase-like protein
MKRNHKILAAAGAAALGVWALRRGAARATEIERLDEVLGNPTFEPIDPYAEPIEPRVSEPRAGVVTLSRKFDSLFREHGRGLPVAYLRALAKRESNMNPRSADGPAWGLLQVTEIVRRDFNERHRTRYARADLLDPRINVFIASDLLQRIIASYERNHPYTPNLREDWSNRRFVELLTFGWNAGYSERGGVGRVAHFLELQGRHAETTIDTIHAGARDAGASRHLSNPRKVSWCKGVAALHARERALEASELLA